MQLPKGIQQRLAREFRFSAEKMTEAPDIATKLFFLSAFYGETNRAMNQAWDPGLALVHLVIQGAYQGFQQRLAAMSAGADRIVQFPEQFPAALERIVADIAELFEDDQIDDLRLNAALAKIAELAYTTTGNGKYLLSKGHIKL